MRLFLTLCSLAALALLAACGTKGLLYLPPAQQAAVPLVRPAGSTPGVPTFLIAIASTAGDDSSRNATGARA